MGLHVHQVEVDEPAAGPPGSHAEVQVLDAVGGEKEGAVRIHLRKPTLGAADTRGSLSHLRDIQLGVQTRPDDRS